MSILKRFGVSMDEILLNKFDKLISEKGYNNRSEAIRDIIRENLVSEEWKSEKGIKVGIVTLVYDHHKRGISDVLNDIQHHMNKYIISTMHIHLDEKNCLELIVVKGNGKKITNLVDRLIGLKGVKHGKFLMTTSGKDLV
ncbi:nickel-responsive transcriptional regulator NikR [candidate division KSB1 bacterium]